MLKRRSTVIKKSSYAGSSFSDLSPGLHIEPNSAALIRGDKNSLDSPYDVKITPLQPIYEIKELKVIVDSEKSNKDKDEVAELPNRAQLAMIMLLCYKEEIRTPIVIGGRLCAINCHYVNGLVNGWVSTTLSNRKFCFDFQPLKSLKKKQLIIAEAKRLYFDYYPADGKKRDPDGKSGIVLCVKKDDECDPNDFNFLDKELIYMAQIMGSRQKYIKMTLTRQKINASVYSESYGSSEDDKSDLES